MTAFLYYVTLLVIIVSGVTSFMLLGIEANEQMMLIDGYGFAENIGN